MALCAPAHLYLFLTLISVVFAMFKDFHPGAIIGKILWMIIWVYALNYLCRKGHSTISWILVLYPFVLLLTVMFTMVSMKRLDDKNDKKHPNLK